MTKQAKLTADERNKRCYPGIKQANGSNRY